MVEQGEILPLRFPFASLEGFDSGLRLLDAQNDSPPSCVAPCNGWLTGRFFARRSE